VCGPQPQPQAHRRSWCSWRQDQSKHSPTRKRTRQCTEEMRLAGLQDCITPAVPTPRRAAPPHFVYAEFDTSLGHHLGSLPRSSPRPARCLCHEVGHFSPPSHRLASPHRCEAIRGRPAMLLHHPPPTGATCFGLASVFRAEATKIFLFVRDRKA
jgi:hypothetical protein